MLQLVHHSIAAGRSLEDRIAVVHRPRGAVVCLADGAGGTPGGSAAADLAVSLASEIARAHDRPLDAALWQLILRRIDHTLSRSRHGGFTTLVVAEVHEGRVSGAYAGNSVAWLVDRGEYAELTGPAGKRPLLGTGLARPATFGPIALTGTLLVASDGLVETLDAGAIVDALARPIRDAAGELALRAQGAGDDVTLALLRAA